MLTHRFRLESFVVLSVLLVVGIFFVVFRLEKTVFAGSAPDFLRYVYFSRGAFGAGAVILLAVLFIRLERRHTRLILRKLSQAVEQSPSSVIITDRTGRIEYVNPRFTRMTGYRKEDVLGKNPRLLQSGKTPPDIYKKFWGAISSGREWKGEFLNKKKGGELYWESISVSPLIDSGDEISHYIGVLEDVSDRKKLETLKDALLGMVSHEMRTPLTVIKWSVRSLEDGLSGPLPKKQHEVIHGISRNLTRLERIINEVLDLSRLESETIPLNRTRFDFSLLVRETVGDFRERLENGELQIEEAMESPLYVEADPDKIIQVLNNLVENALRFATRVITVKARADKECLRVSVIDDGPGIEEADQKKLFDKYQRLHGRGRREQYRGTGLGLAICREIILQHEGKIWVESVPGQGARFHFRVPLGDRGLREEEKRYATVQENTRH